MFDLLLLGPSNTDFAMYLFRVFEDFHLYPFGVDRAFFYLQAVYQLFDQTKEGVLKNNYVVKPEMTYFHAEEKHYGKMLIQFITPCRMVRKGKVLRQLSVEEILQRIYELEDHTKLCAEMSSITSLLHEGIVNDPQNLYLLASDTEEGEKISRILKAYFQPMFRHVHTFSIENLNGEKPELFRDEGLRNLVKVIVQIVRVVPGREEECVINATGGYKAQISFAGLIGQVLKIPVYYQFEGFASVISLPEMPVFFDYKIWLKRFQLFRDLYQLGVISTKLLPERTDLSALKGA